MNVSNILDAINRPNEAPGDYIGPDGLLYCGKCRTPKQTRGEGIMEGKLLSITCACKRAELDADTAAEEKRKADELRALCFPVAAMQQHTFDRASDADHIQKARRYAEQWDRVRSDNIGLLFFGNTGSGKSYTAHCIANALLDHHIPVRYVPAVELVAKLMDRETRRDEYIEKLCKTPLLIIDDIGAERDTAFAREQLCAVIDARSEAGKPLVVTTNYSLSEMRNCTDHALQRIFDRLTALCVPIRVVGESRRAEIGASKMARARELLDG